MGRAGVEGNQDAREALEDRQEYDQMIGAHLKKVQVDDREDDKTGGAPLGS